MRPRPKPVPASTTLPLYERMLAREAEKRSGRRSRGGGGGAARAEAPQKLKEAPPAEWHLSPEAQFKANPAPEAILDPKGWDVLQATEQYRREARGERAARMLATARAPADLDRRGCRSAPAAPEVFPFRWAGPSPPPTAACSAPRRSQAANQPHGARLRPDGAHF